MQIMKLFVPGLPSVVMVVESLQPKGHKCGVVCCFLPFLIPFSPFVTCIC